MKIDELVQNVPADIHDLYLALADLPENTKVKAHSETGISEQMFMSFAHAQRGQQA